MLESLERQQTQHSYTATTYHSWKAGIIVLSNLSKDASHMLFSLGTFSC